MSVDRYLTRLYHKEKYNCLHFTREVWFDLTGEDIQEKFSGLFAAFEERRISSKNIRSFRRIDEPVDPCIVMMTRQGSAPHVGVYLRRRVLHIHELGVEFQPVDVASRAFEAVRYYV